MRSARIHRRDGRASPVIWLILVLFAVVLFALHEFMLFRRTQPELIEAELVINNLKAESEQLMKKVHALQEELKQVTVHVDAQKETRKYDSDKVQEPLQHRMTNSQWSSPLLTGARLMTYLPAKSSPQCNLTPVYQQFRLFGAATDPNNSRLDCKVKSRSRSSAHGSGIHCWGRNVAVDPSKVHVSRGGEDVTTVMGRSEDAETAHVLPGLVRFAARSGMTCNRADLEPHVEAISSTRFFMPLLNSFCGESEGAESEGSDAVNPCTTFDDIPTMFVHRYEYVNLFHTATELLGAFTSLQTAIQEGLVRQDEPVRIIFLDGHAKGGLDEFWSTVFSDNTIETLRMGHLNRDRQGVLCFRRVIFAETGYASDVNIHPPDTGIFNNALSIRSSDPAWCVFNHAVMFGNLVASRYASNVAYPSKPLVVFIARDRGSKPAHPRVKLHAPLERGSSSKDVQALQDRAESLSAKGDVDARVVMFSDMSLKDQIELIRKASVVVSVHGAALTHVMWARPETLFIEISPSGYEGRMHFPKLAARGGKYLARIGNLPASADAFEALLKWSFLPNHESRLSAVGGGAAFL